MDGMKNFKDEKGLKDKGECNYLVKGISFNSIEDFLYCKDFSVSCHYKDSELEEYEKDGLVEVNDGDNFSFYLYSDFKKIENGSFLVLFDDARFVFFALFENGRLASMNRYIFEAMRIAAKENFDLDVESSEFEEKMKELGEGEIYVFEDIDFVLKHVKAYYRIRSLDLNWDKMDNEKYFIGDRKKIFALRYAMEKNEPIFDGAIFDMMKTAGFEQIIEFNDELAHGNLKG